MRNAFFTLILLLLHTSVSVLAQSIQSPADFLGYPLGSKFTYHHKVVDYFNLVDELSELVRVEQYGETYERRELMVAYISAKENLDKLEEIRKNNLRRAGLEQGPIEENDISIVWLSYNVHGNEANSTETAMKVLYELIAADSEKYQDWLTKLIVVIDPCMNPDGRDRYANWYNQVGSNTPNPNIHTREHHEGWTHGRSNHYLFDLNRDWVWQSQIESQQRMKLYNSWLPQVHADLHEQGYNSHYYFAPAAQPMHEQITDWQKEMQGKFGKNHAKYFDEKGWLYFTKERFDLLYPGYGDTYPTYNGAIGMTYEMAGHSLAGLAIKTESGDTLTLEDRINRHFTASISTIEASYQNRQRMLKEFNDFFIPLGNSVFILQSENKDRISLLAKLLDNNKIKYQTPSKSASVKATSFDNDESATIKIRPGDLIVPLNQPKSRLTKILFEKKTKLVDTLTYDITAWSLPYMFGVHAYETNAKLEQLADFKYPDKVKDEGIEQPYAYLLNWSSILDAEFLAKAQAAKLSASYVSKSFTYDGKTYNAGSLIFNRFDNEKSVQDFHSKIRSLASELGRDLVALPSGASIQNIDLGSSKVHFLKKPKIAIAAGEGLSTLNFGEIWYFFEQELGQTADIVKKSMLARIDLNDYDVIILPSGSYPEFSSEAGFKKLDSWINKGGKLILFENAINSFIGEDKFTLEKKKDDDEEEEDKDPRLYPFGDNERENLKRYIQGGIIKLKLDNTHPLAYGYDKEYHTLKNNASSFNYLKKGWNVGYVTSDNEVVAGFVGSETKEKLSKNLVFGVEDRGRGQVVYFADNPLFRAFWQNGKLFVANAIYFDN